MGPTCEERSRRRPPSHPELLEATRDTKTAERLLVVGVGSLGSLFLTALGLRLSTSATRRRRSP